MIKCKLRWCAVLNESAFHDSLELDDIYTARQLIKQMSSAWDNILNKL